MNTDLKKLLKQNDFPQVLMLFGEEEFLIEDAYNTIISSLITNESDKFNFDIFDCDDKNITQMQIAECCSSFPMMSERRIVVLKHFQELCPLTKGKKKENENSPILRYLQNPSTSTVLIILADLSTFNGLTKDLNSNINRDKALKKISSAKQPYNIIFTQHSWIEFPKVWENQQMNWASERLKILGYEISQQALHLLINQTNPDLRSIANSVEQISIFIGNKKNIEIDDVNALSGHSRAYNVFELQKEVGKRNLSKSLIIMNNILKVSKDEIAIIAILTRYFIILWKLIDIMKKTTSNTEIATQLGVSSYFINDYINSVKLFSPSDINNAILSLSKADLALKSTTSDRFIIMQDLMIDIISK